MTQQPTSAGFQAIGTPQTVLAGLVGSGIQLSRTPAMHEREGEAHGLRLVYRLFDTDRMPAQAPSLPELLRAAELCGFCGLNVTYPYKIAVLDHLDALSDNARAVGAVNTIVFRDGKRVGHNTDLWGFGESFRRTMAGTTRDRVLLIGAGGAGVAVAFALLDNGAGHVCVHDSDPARAEGLVAALRQRAGEGAASVAASLAEAASGADGVVNATPVGMAKLPGMPIDPELLDPAMWVVDVIYFPLETDLVKAARERGCRAMGGAGMAVFQAVRAFELFTGLKADPARVHASFASLG